MAHTDLASGPLQLGNLQAIGESTSVSDIYIPITLINTVHVPILTVLVSSRLLSAHSMYGVKLYVTKCHHATRHKCSNAGCALPVQTSGGEQTYLSLWDLGLGVTDTGMVSSQCSRLQCWKRWSSKEAGPAARAVVMISVTRWCNMLLKGYWTTSWRQRDSASAAHSNCALVSSPRGHDHGRWANGHDGHDAV